MIMTFGKYRGRDISDLPSDYLRYLGEKDWFETKYPMLLKSFNEELLERDHDGSHFFGCLKWDRYYKRDH